MRDLADALGHSDSRITERHYVHFSKKHRAKAISENAPVFGFVADNTVVPIHGAGR